MSAGDWRQVANTVPQHHPSCAGRYGGVCTGCPKGDTPDSAAPLADLTCPSCGWPQLVAGETQEVRDRARSEWAGCCTTNTPEAGNGSGDSLASGAQDADPSALEPRTSRQAAGVEDGKTPPAATHPDDLPATYKRRRKVRPGKSRPSLLSGVPVFVARRWAVGL